MEATSQADDSVLADLLSLWQHRRADGETATAAELCRQRPDLLPALERQIAALQQLDALAQAVDRPATVSSQNRDDSAANRAVSREACATVSLDSLEQTPPYRAASMNAPDVPGYEIQDELGRGGMGIVYKARQTKLHRLVALKMILHSYAGDEERLRFQIEAEAVARLHHPHIVQVFEVGEHQGAPYFSLEYCAGGSLADRLDGTPWEAKAAARLVETLARAMHKAHQAQVIHRDLKPGNVLLTAEGEPKVTDFGLAKKLDVQGQTQTGAVMGTPSYMAPEQANGSKDIGPAADVYALGAILYELLTGRPPFRAATALDTILQVVHKEPVSVRQLQPQMPRDIETVCQKCLQKEPKKRYGSAQELAEDLHRFVAGEPVTARPVGRLERSWRWCRRNPTAAILSAALLLMLFAAAAGSTIAAFHLNRTSNEARHNAHMADEARQQEVAARKTAEEREQEAVRQREEARFNQYVAQMNLVQRDYEDNNIGRVRELLKAQRPREADETDFRGFEWHYWQRMANRELVTLKGHVSHVYAVAFSPDGRRLASAGADKTLRLWDAATGKGLLTLNGQNREGAGGVIYGIAFSPDGRRLASVGADRIVRIWDAANGKELLILKGHTRLVNGVAFSPDGRRLASASADGTVRVWDADTAKELLLLKGHVERINDVSFSLDGQRLATAGDDKTIRIWDAVTGKELFCLKGHTGYVIDISFSPDGQSLASASDDKTIRIWDAATGKELLTLNGHAEGVNGICFSSDGRRLASASDDKTIRIWDAATGKELLALKGHTDDIQRVSFSPDGQRLASASNDETVRVWDAATGKEHFLLKGHSRDVESVAFSPDGSRLASASDDKTIRVWNAVAGNELLSLKGHTDRVHCVCFSRDGRRLASAGDDNTVRIWDAASGKESICLKGHTDRVHGVAFSPDGEQLASASWDSTVRVWETATGKELLSLEGHEFAVQDVSFSPNGQRLASASADGTVRVWDAATGKELHCLKGHAKGVKGVCFSPDSRRLASAGSDETVRIWNAATGEELLILKGHTRDVECVCFSPDGSRLASASLDRTVRVWHAATGRELLTLKGHDGPLAAVSFAPDGRRLASAGHDGTVRVWEAVEVPDAIWRQRRMVNEVDSLYEKLLLRNDVLAALRKDAAPDEGERTFLLEVAKSHSENPEALNDAAWEIVKSHDAGKDAYTRALVFAQAAAAQAADDGYYLDTLGIAQYRAGRYTDALATLTRAEKLNAGEAGSLPSSLAFLAMTQHQLGNKDQAKAQLGRLREIMKQPRWAQDADDVGFLHEAEKLIEGEK